MMTLKVLFVGRYDIAEHNVRPEAEMIIGLKRRGVDVEVMTNADCEYARRMQQIGIRVHDHVPQRKFSLRSVRLIRQVLRDGQHDIVHLFNNKAIVGGVHAAYGLPVKVVTYRGQTGNISRLDPICYLTHLSPRVDAIVCVANAVRDSLRTELGDPDKAVTIYKGHDPAWYENVAPARRESMDCKADDFVVICVANNRPRKGVPLLIPAAAQVRDDIRLRVVLVGSGMDGPAVAQRIAATGRPERFVTAGFREDVLNWVAASDAAILPATKREGLPKTVVEAMALGVTPIVTNTGGNAELVEAGVCGLVIPPGDVNAIAEAIETLHDDRSNAAAMSRHAQQRIASHFHLSASVDGHLALYERLTNRAASA